MILQAPKRGASDDDAELKALLMQHNKKVLSQQSDYDINGRKAKVQPNFCPAPPV